MKNPKNEKLRLRVEFISPSGVYHIRLKGRRSSYMMMDENAFKTLKKMVKKFNKEHKYMIYA